MSCLHVRSKFILFLIFHTELNETVDLFDQGDLAAQVAQKGLCP